MTFNVKFFNRTMTHELGHGAFAYEHPFDYAAYKTGQGTTHNLMDYVADDDLAYFQWQSTLGLNLTWGFLEGDEDAMFTDKMFLYDPNFRLFTTLNKMNVLGLEYQNSPWKGDKPYFDFCLKCTNTHQVYETLL